MSNETGVDEQGGQNKQGGQDEQSGQDHQGEFVTIAVFPEPMEANMARSALEAAGIRVFLQGENANSMIPVAFASQLQVHAEDEAAARGLLEAMVDDPESLESVTAAEIAAEDEAK